MKSKTFTIIAAFCLLVMSSELSACTDFAFQSADGNVINGRSMEFPTDLHTTLKLHPRKEKRVSNGPNGPGLEWVSKYGFIEATAFGLDVSVDGLNEKGLSLGFLWLPGTEYQKITAENAKQALDFVDFGAWVLGNFATVAELKKQLPNVKVWGHPLPLPQIDGIPPLHAAVHDAKGNHLVIEFTKGEMKVYDNHIGVLTNFPTFDWMVTNLDNYVNLSATNVAAIQKKNYKISPTGQGTGLLGLPGDWTPPSRFVKMATYLRIIPTPKTTHEATSLANHLMFTVDIPKGAIQFAPDAKESPDYTQWVVIKDLKNKIFYFRSYDDLNLKFVDLTKVNFAPDTTYKELSIDSKLGNFDVTAQM